MTIGPLVPCIWLGQSPDQDAERAAELYSRTFPDTRVTATSRYPLDADNPGKRARGSVLTVELTVAGLGVTLLNGGPQLRPDPTLSFFFFAKDHAEVDRIAASLLVDGVEMMPLGTYPWSERYAWVQDRFGVSWQIMLAPDDARGDVRVMPCLMFAGPQHGKAAAWIESTVRSLAGEVKNIEKYKKGEHGPEGSVKHARLVLGGTLLAAMDAHQQNDLGFTDGLSLQVMCDDQAEVDHVWSSLTANGGREGPCGWLTDRFGCSWQVVPRFMVSWMTSTDTTARDRAFASVMKMKKLDIAVITKAFEQR